MGCRLYVYHELCLLTQYLVKKALQLYFSKVHIHLVNAKTKLSLRPSINFQSSHVTRVNTLVSMTTKGIECWIGQKETKLNVIS